jgi:hypothetical protein
MLYNLDTLSFYESVFFNEYQQLWAGTGFEKNDYEMRNLCYYRALAAFYSQRNEDINDRRALLYSYLENEYNTIDANSTINRYKKTLPIDSLIPQIMKRKTILYDESPARSFYDNNENSEQILNEIYNQANIDSILKYTYSLAKYLGLVLIMPIIKDETLKIRILTPDKFRVNTEQENNDIITELWYNNYDPTQEKYYHIQIMPDVINYTDLKGKPYIPTGFTNSTIPNEYGVIPAVLMRFGIAEDIYTQGEYQMFESQLIQNKLKFQSLLDAAYNASPIKLGRNLPQNTFSVAPDQMLLIPDLAVNDQEPSLEFIQGNPQFLPVDEYRHMLSEEVQRNQGIPYSMINGDTNPPSGISRLLEMQELLEQRAEDIPKLTNFEGELARMIRVIINNDLGYNLPELQFSVTFSDVRIQTEVDVEYNHDTMLYNNYLLDPAEYIKKWGNVPESATVDEVAAIIKQRKEDYDKINLSAGEIIDNEEDTFANEIEQQEENLNKII